jgi:hypothetical protein
VTGWQIGSAVFFGCIAAIALASRRMARGARLRVLAGAAVAAALLATSLALPADGIMNTWFLPPALLLLGYWTSGCVFVAPMPRAEAVLARIDAALRIDAIAARIPAPIVELLELAYIAIYPLVGVALALALWHGVPADRFWTVLLLTDFVCFGGLALVQTRPPRSCGIPAPWRSRVRALNVQVLDATSVQVNTFPSGHAAEALAIALLLIETPAPLPAGMFAAAAAISSGVVFGRYHYAADALAGWGVALLVWTLVVIGG